MITFNFTEKDTKYYNKWLSFYPKFQREGFRFTVSSWSYFDPRPQIVTSVSSLLTLILIPFLGFYSFLLLPFLFFSWGQIFLSLPYNTKEEECGYPDYGLIFYSVNGEIPNHIWIRKGFKGSTINFPWAKKFWKREVFTKDGWVQGEDFWDEDKWKNKIVKEIYPYNYTLKSGNIQKRTAEIYQEKRYWRNWFKLNTYCRKIIEVTFNDEVGERSGSWKGGTIGCGYEMKKGETPLDTLRRMEKERKF